MKIKNEQQAHRESDHHSFQAPDEVEFIILIGIHQIFGSRNDQLLAVAHPDPVNDEAVIPVNNEPDEIGNQKSLQKIAGMIDKDKNQRYYQGNYNGRGQFLFSGLGAVCLFTIIDQSKLQTAVDAMSMGFTMCPFIPHSKAFLRSIHQITKTIMS